MPRTENVDKFFTAVNEAYDALLDAAKSANDRGYRVSRQLIDEVERDQREAIDLTRRIASSPRDVSGFYTAPVLRGVSFSAFGRFSSGLRHCRLAPLHLLHRNVFDVGRQPPLVAEPVFDPGAAVPVELVLRLAQGLAARLQRPIVCRIDVVHIKVGR